MSPRRADELDTLVQSEVTNVGVAPCAVAALIRADEDEFIWGGSGADENSIFDLASLTKVCVALTALLMAQSRDLDLERRACEFVPDLAGSLGGEASLRALLSHRSGLMPHRRLYSDSWAGRPVSRVRLIREAAQARGTPAGEAHYSDLGFILVGAVLEAVAASPLDALIEELLARPLGLTLGSARLLRARGLRHFVPTEVQPDRGGLIQGAVHDDNAWALAGLGCAGHAGLFGTVSSVARLGSLLVQGYMGKGVFATRVPVLVAPLSEGLGSGVMFPTGRNSQAGNLAGRRCFGHLGFTGTSLWCDPDRGVATVLLSNRVFPRRNPRPEAPSIARARREVHDGLWARADAVAN